MRKFIICALFVLAFIPVASTDGQTPLPGASGKNASEAQRRGISGAVVALNPQAKEITLRPRGPEGTPTLIITTSDNVRYLRYALDSLKRDDAHPSIFAELKVGDQLRARGEKSADGTRFAAEEIISGSLTRAVGAITALDVAAGELAIKDQRTSRALVVRIGQKSTLKRVTAESAASLVQNGGQASGAVTAPSSTAARPAPERTGGRSLQQLLDRLPMITLADLKKGDMISVFGSTSADSARVTAITLVTGDAAFIKSLQRTQSSEPGRTAPDTNTGLPGDVLGGGTEKNNPPPSRTDPP